MHRGEASDADKEPLYLGPDPDTRPPSRIVVTPGGCDSHAHILGPHDRFPLFGRPGVSPPEALVGDYLGMLDALGIERGVLVQPSAYGVDNSALVAAIGQAAERLRGIAIVDPEQVTGKDLRALRDCGVRGVRFNTRGSLAVSAGRSAAISLQTVKAMGPRLADAGLHAQLLLLIDQHSDAAQVLADYPVDIVVDHMGYPDPRLGHGSGGLRILLDWLQTGRCWVKLSAPYRFSRQDLPYADVVEMARMLAVAAPDRIVWGSDWPHTAAFGPGDSLDRSVPNDGELLDLLLDWCPDATSRKRILTDNPAELYGF